MIVCDVCKKEFTDRDIYVNGQVVGNFDLFYPKHWSSDTQDLCEKCLTGVLNFMGHIGNGHISEGIIINRSDIKAYFDTFEWSVDSSEEVKSLVLGNINGFMNWLGCNYNIKVDESK